MKGKNLLIPILLVTFLVSMSLVAYSGPIGIENIFRQATAIQDESFKNNIVAEVNGEIITKADFIVTVEQVKMNLTNMQKWASEKDNPTAEFNKKFLEIMKKYSIEDIAFATAIKNTALFADAKNKDMVPSGEAVQKQVKSIRDQIDDTNMPEEVNLLISIVGKNEYWDEIVPRGQKQFSAIANLKTEIMTNSSSQVDVNTLWNNYEQDIVNQVKIVVVDDSGLDIDIIRALQYLNEYYDFIITQ